jgi:hypothetical protein
MVDLADSLKLHGNGATANKRYPKEESDIEQKYR